MAQYDFDVSLAPSGVCPPKLTRAIKAALSLARKPRLIFAGTMIPGTDNLGSGTFSVFCRPLTDPEVATLTATIQSHVPCEPNTSANKPDFGLEVEDLDDIFAAAMPGQIFYLRDLPRAGSESATSGTLVYRTRNGWRRVSDDTVIG